MFSGLGLPRINIHKVRKTIDASNQVTPTSNIEYVCCIMDNGVQVTSNISNNVATITENGYGEGDEVDMYLLCLRPSEGGGICEQNIVQADEDKYNNYLQLLK